MITKNVTIKQLVEFRRYSDQRKQSFARQIQAAAANKSGEGGGDYWISSLSALANAYKAQNNQFITDKIDQLNVSYNNAKHTNTKDMYKRNLEILQIYNNFDFSVWVPSFPLSFLARPKVILPIKNVPLQIIPHHIFAFEQNGEQTVGGVWFVHWLRGFRPGDLAMYTDALYQYLRLVYGANYTIDPNYCLTIDVVDQSAVSYEQIQTKVVTSPLESTIDELNKLI